MRVAVAALLAVALQGCSGESADAAEQEAAAPADAVSGVVTAAPPAGVDMRNLEPLGDIAGVDLGAQDGNCTFSFQGNTLLVAGAPDDAAASGKAVVRAGGELYLLTAPRGGIEKVRGGTLFTGAGFMVRVVQLKPAKFNKAQVEVFVENGQMLRIGEWNCT